MLSAPNGWLAEADVYYDSLYGTFALRPKTVTRTFVPKLPGRRPFE